MHIIFLSETLKERDHLVDIGVDGKGKVVPVLN
jgi:hypothetical protein